MITGEQVIESTVRIQKRIMMSGTGPRATPWINVYDKAGNEILEFPTVEKAEQFVIILKALDKKAKPLPYIVGYEYRIVRQMLSVVKEAS